jgi:hypothetical protein
MTRQECSDISNMHQQVRKPSFQFVSVRALHFSWYHLFIPLFGHLVQLPLIRLESLGDPIFKCQFTSFHTRYISMIEERRKDRKKTYWTLSVNFLISSITHRSLFPTSSSLSWISCSLSLCFSFLRLSRSDDRYSCSESSSCSRSRCGCWP